MRKIRLVLLLFVALFGSSTTVFAQPAQQRSWNEEKCVRYKDAWQGALQRWGRDGLGSTFIERHEAFIAGGCTGVHDVCPRSTKEIELANVLTIRALNAGMASTFLPFKCD